MKSIVLGLLLVGLAFSPVWADQSPFSAPSDGQIRSIRTGRTTQPKQVKPAAYQELRKLNALPPAPTTVFDYKIDPKLWADEPRVAVAVPASGGNAPASTRTATASAALMRLKGSGDYTGHGESLRMNGSPDSQLALTVQAPQKTLAKLVLRTVGDKKPQWDTTPGNGVWLVVVTKKGEAVNRKDGTIRLAMGPAKQKLDLWVQDNHTLARGKQGLELVMSFSDGQELVVKIKDDLKR